MRDGRLSFWLIVGGIYALYTGFHWGGWQDLALWTRVHAVIEVSTGVFMLLGGVVLMVARGPWRAPILAGALAPGLLGVSLIAGALSGTIPCTGGS